MYEEIDVSLATLIMWLTLFILEHIVRGYILP